MCIHLFKNWKKGADKGTLFRVLIFVTLYFILLHYPCTTYLMKIVCVVPHNFYYHFVFISMSIPCILVTLLLKITFTQGRKNSTIWNEKLLIIHCSPNVVVLFFSFIYLGQWHTFHASDLWTFFEKKPRQNCPP